MAETQEIVDQPQTEVTAPTVEATATVDTTTANTETSTAPEVTEQAPATEVIPEATTAPKMTVDEILAQQGLSKSEIEEFKAQKAAKREEEEKPLKEQKEWVDILKFAVDKGIATKDEFINFEQIGKKEDKDIVFEAYKAAYKNEEGLKGEELAEAIQADFEDEYNLNATSERALAKANAAIKAEAAEIRKSSLGKIDTARTEYNKVKTINELHSQHKSLISELNASPVKQTVEINGKQVEIEMPVEISEEAITAALKSEQGAPLLNFMYGVFQDNKEAAAEIFKQFALNTAASPEAIMKKAVEATWAEAEQHFKEVYAVGAKAPFGSTPRENATQPIKTQADFFRERYAQA